MGNQLRKPCVIGMAAQIGSFDVPVPEARDEQDAGDQQKPEWMVPHMPDGGRQGGLAMNWRGNALDLVGSRRNGFQVRVLSPRRFSLKVAQARFKLFRIRINISRLERDARVRGNMKRDQRGLIRIWRKIRRENLAARRFTVNPGSPAAANGRPSLVPLCHAAGPSGSCCRKIIAQNSGVRRALRHKVA